MSLSTSDPLIIEVEHLVKEGLLPTKFASLMKSCYLRYLEVISKDEVTAAKRLFADYFSYIRTQLHSPYRFSLYHEKLKTPIDYEAFGKAFVKPLIIFETSQLIGKEQLKQIEAQLQRGENVIFLANHQTETDPQILLLMLEKEFPLLSSSLIFVAGSRVTTDPMAIPFSLGCNLFCIYSKRHIDHPPEKKTEKLLHNQKTLKRLVERLSEGGAAIYIAPSGGRDRRGIEGTFEIAPYDGQSIEILTLLTEEAKKTTHFYPLALNTHGILPPPPAVDVELGEERLASRAAVGLAFGSPILMNRITGDAKTKRELRQRRAHEIWETVKELYKQLL